MSLAIEMASAGRKVVVIERGRAMGEASWAAAGMLAARDPENPPALRPLSELSLQLYPEFLNRLSGLAGREIRFRTQATLQATRVGGSFAGLAALTGPATAPSTGRRLDHTQAMGYVEGLVPGHRHFLLLEEQSLDPRDLCNALPLAAKTAGVSIVEDTTVKSIYASQAGVNVRTNAGVLYGGEFVDCRGAWAGLALDGSFTSTGTPGKQPSIWPRKGQMVTVEIADPTALQVVVRTPEIYLVPRGDGRIVIGATVEDAGFDKAVAGGAVSGLLADASALWPPLRQAQVVASWAGLRPGSKDDLPLIGADQQPHCWQAAGHFRNGILLAPATAALMRQLMDGQTPQVLAGFSPQRFQ